MTESTANTADIIIVEETDNHVAMAKVLVEVLKQDTKPKQKNLTPVPLHQATRDKKIALVMMPMWGHQIAPYAIARMAGISRHMGFETKCWDVNIECYAATAGELWNHLWDWKWDNAELYENEILPIIQPTLEQQLEEIVAFNPSVVGFTIYYCNLNCVDWMVTHLKHRLPKVKIIAGGPQANHAYSFDHIAFDHVIRGEGELLFSQLLENIDSDESALDKFLTHDKKVRIDLDSVPNPDYRDFNIQLYQFKGVAGEISRGCIAKCAFCYETTFWGYRGRLSTSVLDEVEYNYKTFGIEVVWFIDSLINGNLKELLLFAEGLIERNINVRWWGFSRNDGRMDKQYLATLLKSGWFGSHFGIESGSQKVIDLIQKKVKVAEIEQNFADLGELNALYSGTSWFFGFPGEEPIDVAHTYTLMWHLRNAGIQNKGIGFCSLDGDSPINSQREKYNIANDSFGGDWYTKDWKNTGAHRIIRYKGACILLNHYRLHKVRDEHLGHRGEQLGYLQHYTLEYNTDNWVDKIPYENDFDYNIINANINPLADSLVNEIWSILRVLWLTMGAFKLNIGYSPEIDYPVLGDYRYFRGNSGKLWANYSFTIDDVGNWSADFYTKLHANYYDDNIDRNFEHSWKNIGHWERPTI